MLLTKFQVKVLRAYREYSVAPPTVGRLVQKMLPYWLLISTWFAVGAALCWRSAPIFAAISIGISIGFILRDFGHIRVLAAAWPAVERVLDRQKLDELLEEYDQAEKRASEK